MSKTIEEWNIPSDILTKWGYDGELEMFKNEKLIPNIGNIFRVE